MRRISRWAMIGLLVGCAAPDQAEDDSDPQALGFEPPVVTNPEPPVEYPADLYEQQVEGVVLVHLYLDEQGAVVADSTRIHESSGYPGLDSAALRSVTELTFAPAHLDGAPVATVFLQPFHFRHPDLAAVGENQ